MIDPVSIIELVHTAGTVAGKLAQVVKSLVEAPEEILALSNETWNLQLVLESWSEKRRSSTSQRVDKSDIEQALFFQARVKLDDLSELVGRYGRLNQYGDSWNMGRRQRFLWVKEKKRIIKLQSTLRDLRCNIIAATGIHVSTAVMRLEVDVQNLASQYTRLNEALAPPEKGPVPTSDATQASTEALDSIKQTQSESKDILLEMLTAMEKMNTEQQVDRRFDNYIDQQHSTRSRKGSSSLANTPLSDDTLSKPIQSSSDQSVFSMAIKAKLKSRHSCAVECACPCHSKTVVQTPQLLQRVTGRLFLGYTGTPCFRVKCLPGCTQAASTAFNMTYFFPHWFFEKAISLSMTEGFLGTPSLNIKLRRVVPEMSHVFAMSRYGDVEGLKALFMERKASPDDVHIRGGWNPLHFAIDHGNVEACKLLLECGADPEWEDATGTTPVEIAWRNILHLRAPPRISETFSVLFPGTEYLQERKFTRLHRLVIELESGDLDKEIMDNPESVHTADIDGWTPLHWAARRGNIRALTLLLAYGADPLQGTENENRNALHLAAQGNSVSCVQHLLQYRRGNTFVDIECKDGYGRSPLLVAAGYNCAAATAKLIEKGADINTTDSFGEPSLFSAIYENAHETITLMLNAGTDYTVKTKFGNTVLHFAANESDTESLILLTRARMRGVDTMAKNDDGLTASDLAAARDRAPAEFMMLFDRLIASIEENAEDFEARSTLSNTSSGAESWKDFEDTVWFDAEKGVSEDILEQKEQRSIVQYDAQAYEYTTMGTSDSPGYANVVDDMV